MSSALYAISYVPTGGVVALCSFEKQELLDQAAWDRLRDTLVGTRLPISLPTGGVPLEIPPNELGCDLVRVPSRQDYEDALAEPYRFRVSLDPEESGPVRPGDGREKVLRRANKNAVQSITLIVAGDVLTQVKVTLASPVSVGVDARLLFEGEFATRVASATRDPTVSDLFFKLGSDAAVTPGASYGVIFFMAGVLLESRSVRVSDSKASAATTPTAAPAAPAVSPPKVNQ
jgi:hypothetical protein